MYTYKFHLIGLDYVKTIKLDIRLKGGDVVRLDDGVFYIVKHYIGDREVAVEVAHIIHGRDI